MVGKGCDWKQAGGRRGEGQQSCPLSDCHLQQQYKIGNMITILVIFLNILALLAQKGSLPSSTLRQLAAEQAGLPTDYSKAVGFLSKTHPQLADYLVLGVTTDLKRGDQTYAANLRDYHFELSSKTKKVLAIVTISVTNNQEFVSISPFVMQIPQADGQNNIGEYWISETIPTGSPDNIIIQPITSEQAARVPINSQGTLPGGFNPYPNLTDPLVDHAMDFLAGEHPNLVNYRATGAAYQVVAGVNVRLQYKGIDQYSTLTAVINFDLKNNARIIFFEAGCGASKQFCSRTAVREYYGAVEAMVISHPELLNYRISSAVVEEGSVKGTLRAVVTLDNRASKLRTLVELVVSKNKSTVQSFFTYSQEP